ncbi:MAG TPA: ROK family protein, partial [Chthonomonadaceae bacterium]|nr:ROK family protein [Chthonomonadaceae bacterium]
MQPRPNASYVVGVDLGGTNVRAAVVDKNEKLLGRAQTSSDAKSGVTRTVARIGEVVRSAASQAQVSLDEIGAVGIAVPGHIDVPGGMIRWAPNFGDHEGDRFVPYKNI